MWVCKWCGGGCSTLSLLNFAPTHGHVCFPSPDSSPAIDWKKGAIQTSLCLETCHLTCCTIPGPEVASCALLQQLHTTTKVASSVPFLCILLCVGQVTYNKLLCRTSQKLKLFLNGAFGFYLKHVGFYIQGIQRLFTRFFRLQKFKRIKLVLLLTFLQIPLEKTMC